MKKQTFIRIMSALMALCMLFLSACASVSQMPETQQKPLPSDGVIEGAVDNCEKDIINADTLTSTKPKGDYNEGVVLVKSEDELTAEMLGELDYTKAEPLYAGSAWYAVTLADSVNTEDAAEYLASLDCFDAIDYDYVMGVTDKEKDNPNYDDQVNLGLSNIPNGWTHNGKAPGGSPDVVVAVIDTGVDYNHLDLRNNIWINTAEIPDNGKDDDGNGYIDDIYGWDCVGNDKDPMDDNGHGTHVAGIIAAENNKEGGIGVAYNCKVMVLKAGNSSGYFNNSDIAEAIQYAYMNGASVINMSFGGSNISIAVEEALENAYNTCVLVAAAGNDGACNNLACRECDKVGVSYPAALPYVIGVMSTDKDGKLLSSFSNYDHNPYDSIEYEVYAVGEGVGSTWPSNKYACLNGTSMAAPTVAGIAALLRSYYSDREVYSTKFIQSQIVNTGTVNPYNALLKATDRAHSVADVKEALTKLPKPFVNLYDYYIDDSIAIYSANNGNGVIDAGETVRLYISLHNRGGVASNVNVSIDTDRGMGMTDPYFTFVNPTMQLSDIGTYSVRESGDKYFEIIVDEKCPNAYLVDFNIRFTYTNGLDANDKTVYEDDGKQKAQFNVSKGYLLPATIDKDTVYTADKLYIVGQNVVIPQGVTVTFEAGCQIQFHDGREYYNSPEIMVYGTLIFDGAKDDMIYIFPSEALPHFTCKISYDTGSKISAKYVKSINLNTYYTNTASQSRGNACFYNSSFEYSMEHRTYIFNAGGIYSEVHYLSGIDFDRCYINWENAELAILTVLNLYNSFLAVSATGSSKVYVEDSVTNNVFYSAYNASLGSVSSIILGEYSRGTTIENNFFLSKSNTNSRDLMKISNYCGPSVQLDWKNNTFSKAYQTYASQLISGYYDSTGTPTVDVYDTLADASLLWPHVVSVEMFDKDGDPITTVGREEIKVRVTFNRAMDTTQDTFLTFGTIEPYADYRIDGEWVSDTVWEGSYTLKAQIENGQNFLKVNNACAKEDTTKTVFGEYQLHEFTIDTTAAMSMNLQAVAKANGIELTFAQDDYDTLLGYNIYRADSKDGNYVKLNPAILLPTDEKFLDENAEPGKTYWYTYTVVLTDFTESNPAGKVVATAMDTLAPNMYHTPVNQGYMNNNLVISCTASDNVAIESVVLYYRAVGATEWRTLTMVKQNDKYSATIFGSDLTLDGIEYYIVAYDTNNSITKGSADTPYTIVIKDASSISRLGDVDGDGTVTTKDALMLMQAINEERILTDDEFKRADLNKDGVLSSVEALRILQYINGNVNTLEM